MESNEEMRIVSGATGQTLQQKLEEDLSPQLYQSARDTLAKRLAEFGNSPLFFTQGVLKADIPGQVEYKKPFKFFHAALPEGMQREYKCKTCEHFLNRAAQLVFIKEDGTCASALWDETAVPPAYFEAVRELRWLAENSPVSAPFRPSDFDEVTNGGKVKTVFEGSFGARLKGAFEHFHIDLPADLVQKTRERGNGGAKRIDTLQLNLEFITLQEIDTLIALFNSERLYRKEQYLPRLQWLREIKVFLSTEKNLKLIDNYLALKAVSAPAGWVEYRTNMEGTLFKALREKQGLDRIFADFNYRVDSERFMRATAPASEGNIIAAQKVIDEQGTEKSFLRRWATVDELKELALWVPKPVAPVVEETPAEEKTGGLFGKMLEERQVKKEAPKGLLVDVPPTPIPLFKFLRDVLPQADAIQIQLGQLEKFGGVTTAQHADAPPIFKYDTLEARNPFSSFWLQQNVPPSGLLFTPGQWVNVKLITHEAEIMRDPVRQAKANSLGLVIEGAKEFNLKRSAIFKEDLKAIYNGFGQTFEEFSNKTPLAEVPDDVKAVTTNLVTNRRLKVTSKGVTTVYQITTMDV